MRAVAIAALATSLLSATALAADYDPGPLRGTQYIEPVVAPVTIWEGPYFGGFGGVTQSHFEYQNSFTNLVAGLSNVRDTTLEKEYAISTLLHGVGGKDRHTTSYGGFAGYNWQFEDVVFGFEVDYVHARLNGSRSDSIGRIMVTSDNVSHDVYLTGTASAELQDYGSVRVRAGYTSGPFLLFITAGVAFGGLNTATTVTARLAGYDQTAYTVSGRWPRVEDSWAVEQRVGWCAVSRGGRPWRKSSPSAVAFSIAISSNPAQTSIGGPSHSSRPNQPEIVL
jgi:outer membrane immunogenic protein